MQAFERRAAAALQNIEVNGHDQDKSDRALLEKCIDMQKRETVCQGLGVAFQQRDLLSLLPLLNHDNVEQRIHWAISVLLDVVKYQQGATSFIVNQDCFSTIQNMAGLSSAVIFNQISQKWLSCRHDLFTVAGVNRELLLTNMLNQTDLLLA